MSNENEVKSPQDVVEQAFDALTAPKDVVQENSPENVQAEEAVQDEANSVKTGTPVAETVNEKLPESVPYKRFQEINQQVKEAKEALKQREIDVERYSKLLDDPQVYAVWLKQQGYSDAHIQAAMREKGFQAPNAESTEKSNQAQAIAERACAKLGWDINRLSPDQKAYINDSVSLTMAIIQEAVGPMIEQRVKPYEQVSNEWNQQKQYNQEEAQVKELASKEFPEADWAEVIQPAIQKFLNDLDEKDPKRTIKLSYEDIYYRATRPLLREITESKGRQEVRDANKRNARPLGTGPTTTVNEPAVKLKPRESLEKRLDAMGIR